MRLETLQTFDQSDEVRKKVEIFSNFYLKLFFNFKKKIFYFFTIFLNFFSTFLQPYSNFFLTFFYFFNFLSVMSEQFPTLAMFLENPLMRALLSPVPLFSLVSSSVFIFGSLILKTLEQTEQALSK